MTSGRNATNEIFDELADVERDEDGGMVFHTVEPINRGDRMRLTAQADEDFIHQALHEAEYVTVEREAPLQYHQVLRGGDIVVVDDTAGETLLYPLRARIMPKMKFGDIISLKTKPRCEIFGECIENMRIGDRLTYELLDGTWGKLVVKKNLVGGCLRTKMLHDTKSNLILQCDLNRCNTNFNPWLDELAEKERIRIVLAETQNAMMEARQVLNETKPGRRGKF